MLLPGTVSGHGVQPRVQPAEEWTRAKADISTALMAARTANLEPNVPAQMDQQALFPFCWLIKM